MFASEHYLKRYNLHEVNNKLRMACEYIQPSTFVCPGEKIEAVFLDDDKKKWYKGTVVKVNKYSEDKYGRYVECKVEYEDGEVVDDARFYDCDFNDSESSDAWRFTPTLTRVIEALDETKREIQDMKDETYTDDDSDDDASDDPPRQTFCPVSRQSFVSKIASVAILASIAFTMKGLVETCYQNEIAHHFASRVCSSIFSPFSFK